MTLRDVAKSAREEGRSQLTEIEAKMVVAEAGIPTTMPRSARSAAEAASLAKEIGFPVVLKIDSPDIVHKSDAGGVQVGIESEAGVVQAYEAMLEDVARHAPDARINGVTVQQMAPPGIEVIVGVSRDLQFGPVLMFGLGGVLVEVLQDVSFRVLPITRWDARQMIRDLKGYPVLRSFRGQPAASLEGLECLLLKVSGLVDENPEIDELDLNPVFAYPDGAVAVDARISLRT
jgi:acetyl-CoA synthetase (ADP-forming)